MDPDAISAHLESASTPDTARATSRQVHTLKGIRGTPLGEVARVTAQVWKDRKPTLPRDEDALTTLFGTAWEDGLVAVGLLAACVPDRPDDALEIARDWLERVDDAHTADALGWMVLGPSALAGTVELRTLLNVLKSHGHPAVRRAGVAMGLAMTPARLEGPSAAALREKLGTKDVQFVERALSDRLVALADAFLRDEDPSVRKALRRVLGEWALSDPDAAVAWLEGVRGGVPKMIRDEVEKSARKGRRVVGRASVPASEDDDT